VVLVSPRDTCSPQHCASLEQDSSPCLQVGKEEEEEAEEPDSKPFVLEVLQNGRVTSTESLQSDLPMLMLTTMVLTYSDYQLFTVSVVLHRECFCQRRLSHQSNNKVIIMVAGKDFFLYFITRSLRDNDLNN
jgi:hypothetical protein